MKIYLPIVLTPYIRTRASTAFQLSVIQAQEQYSDSWLCKELFNLRYLPNDKIRCDFLNKDFWYTGTKMFYRQSLLFSKEIVDFKSFNIYKYIETAICSGKYIVGDYDTYFISAYREYKVLHRNEPYLIYGFDNTQKEFYVLGYTKKGYTSFILQYDEYLMSITGRNDGMFNLNIMEYNNLYSFDFSSQIFISKLSEYVQSLNYSSLSDVERIPYGINAIAKYHDDLLVDVTQSLLINEKSLLVIHEHKNIMMQRFRFLIENGFESILEFYQKANRVLELSNEMLLNAEKYRNTRDMSFYRNVLDCLEEVIDEEKRYLPKTIDWFEKWMLNNE